MKTLNTKFKDLIKEAVRLFKSSTKVTENNVYQEGNAEIVPLLDKMVETLILPGSGITGMEHLRDILQKAKEGHSCLLLLEHFSNMDLSLFHYLVRKEGCGELTDALVAIAGMKLTEDNPVVAAFASAYTRIIICPSRSIQGLDPEKKQAELIRFNAINRAAMKSLADIKTKGKIILVFPSGTRYRPWDPDSKKGVREIDSYIKSFEYMCMVAINGEVLHVRPGDMMDDSVSQDVVRLTVGPVLLCTEFRNAERAKAVAAGIEDKKQATVDAIMTELDKLHAAAAPERETYLNNAEF
jgi:glycerol-3-phosphate O-acyltransferase